MTQHQLASAAKTPQPTIARIEAGSVTPRTATLLALLEATGHQLVAEPIGQSVPTGAIRQRLTMDVSPHGSGAPASRSGRATIG